MGVMVARRLVSGVLVSVCVLLLCVLVACMGSAAAASQFGSQGIEAGQLRGPAGVAVDAAGDVYVGDLANGRVDKFDGSGIFLWAAGNGVASAGNEQETCTSFCLPSGLHTLGVATDDDPLSSSYGAVYALAPEAKWIAKYDSSGKFLFAFGGHVNRTTGGDVCTRECQVGSEGTSDGEFGYWRSLGNFIAVGPGGAVYVGDKARVQVFESSGAWRENISLSGLSSEARPSALAVDPSGDVYVKDEGVPGVREFEPNGTEKAVQFDAGSTTVTALALDTSGDLYVGDDSGGGFHVLQYDPAGNEVASFGSKTVAGENHGLAFSAVTNEVYASSSYCPSGAPNPEKECESSVWAIGVPAPGPLVDREGVAPGLRGAATLEATINTEGHETAYHFEYVDDAHYKNGGFASAASTASVSLPAGFEDVSVSGEVTGLVPGETYHYRIVASDTASHTTSGPDQSFEETPPARIEGLSASSVAGTSATFSARIDPLGASTTYRLEYGTSTSYGQLLTGSVGGGMEYVPVTRHVQELQQGTTYHYRIVTSNEVGAAQSGDHTFTTQVAGNELVLPDGRSWELVSPADKKGDLIIPYGVIQAAGDGSGITYQAWGMPFGEGVVGHAGGQPQVLSVRGSGGWSTRDIELPQVTPPPERSLAEVFTLSHESYKLFSPDLSLALLKGTAWLPVEGVEGTPYLRDNVTGRYEPLFTSANLPPGTEGGLSLYRELAVEYATPNLSHVIVRSPLALTKDAMPRPGGNVGEESNLYEWNEGRLQLVNILPNREQTPEGEPNSEYEIRLAARLLGSNGNPYPVSSDGRWVAWTWGGNPYRQGTGGAGLYRGLYLRDMVRKETVRVGGFGARYQSMSADGSRVFFVEGSDLYEFDTATDTQTDLTAKHGAGESNAGVKEEVIDISKDGSYVYFVATGALAGGGVGGQDNLYVLHATGSEWVTKHVATLSSEDEADWSAPAGAGEIGFLPLARRVSRTSPNGRYLAFMSSRPLTGYDNTDAVTGLPDEEVYLYDAVSGRLACASCDPTGARPVGILDNNNVLMDPTGAWQEAPLNGWPNHWLAAAIPGWSINNSYQSRYLSDSGRLFFNSPDALVPQATNGVTDVYQYEPVGVGGCTAGDVTFSERSYGCVDLISSGISDSESVFMDASENGNDVFFITTAKLVRQVYDTAYDVYDAHVCSASAPCLSVRPVSPPPCNSGDSCKAAPSPQPEVFGPAPSATFSGVGNMSKEPAKRVLKHRRMAKHKRHARHKRRKSRKASGSHALNSSAKGRG
jgi:hypothetical protein